MTADVFHLALKSLPRFEWRGVPFAAWLFRIASNEIADRSKSIAKRREHERGAVFEVTDDRGGIVAGVEEAERRGGGVFVVGGGAPGASLGVARRVGLR